ncbi:MAG: VanZ family protein [Candidatus Omnitrophica bacterium]|nr:VanZ family protein [Candidatus Omnitrophota bacterium]
MNAKAVRWIIRRRIKDIMPDRIILRYWMPVVIWMAAIFILSSIPGEDFPKIGIPNFDKFVHFFEFFMLGLLLIRAFLNSHFNLSPTKLILLSASLAALYALSDEWHQYFISNRMPDSIDLLTDIIGSSVGIFIYRKYPAR